MIYKSRVVEKNFTNNLHFFSSHYILLVPTEIHSTLLAHPIEPLETTDTVPPRIRGAMRAELGTRRTQDSRERVRWELQQWLRSLEHHVLMWYVNPSNPHCFWFFLVMGITSSRQTYHLGDLE